MKKDDFTVLRMLFVTACIMIIFMLSALIMLLPLISILWGWVAYVVINLVFFEYKVWRSKNPKSKLRKKTQIMVLKYAIDNYEKEHWTVGLCYRIADAVEKITGNSCHYSIQDYMPTFTRENCTYLSGQYGFEKPNQNQPFWWARTVKEDAKTPRLACLNALLQELENK